MRVISLPPNSPSCVTTFLLALIALNLPIHAYPTSESDSLVARQHHDHDFEHDHAHGGDIVLPDTETDLDDAISDPSSSGTVSSAPTASQTPPDPHSHSHGSHEAPMYELNDTAIHFWHQYPPSYLAADFRLDKDSAIFGEEFDETWEPENESSHKGLVVLHTLGFYTAYFGVLPIALALRAADHPAHYLVNGAFLVLATLGWLAGAAYNAATPDRYEGSSYPKFVNILLLTSYILATIDSLDLIKRAISFWRSGRRSWVDFKAHVFRSDEGRWLGEASRYEMVGLVDESGNREAQEGENGVMFALGDDEDEEAEARPSRTLSGRPTLWRQWSPPSRNSSASEHTLHDSPTAESPTETSHRKHPLRTGAFDIQGESNEAEASGPVWKQAETPNKLVRAGQRILTWIRRTQVVFAYVTLIIGITIYTGMCRSGFLPSCAAHYIKGSIFFGYGLLTFARYLGAYADLGWAWNKRPGGKRGVSAEMVECSVIFVYGITNTWMERFGAPAGSAYSVKQVQHISIAIMFWFAGLSGILLESNRMRRILGAIKGNTGPVQEPPTYAFSFNPLPALVIAVTGLAMAAHHQTYVFQVEIHSLWGILLAGGSACRFLTYFFLWLRPPTDSTLPSRPPTEVLTSFGWAAGGIVFMLSNEEICFAAMRAGYDDMMAFLNVTIALTSLVFCWTVAVMAVKGWGVIRMTSRSAIGADRA